MIGGSPEAGFGLAWIAATVALGLHVADEASHDFLAWYNPRALRIRAALRPIPFPPTFSFGPWLAGLVVATLGLASLIPVAFRGPSWLRILAFVLAGIHIANGSLHVIGSLSLKRLVPGVISAPLLLITGGWLLLAALALR